MKVAYVFFASQFVPPHFSHNTRKLPNWWFAEPPSFVVGDPSTPRVLTINLVYCACDDKHGAHDTILRSWISSSTQYPSFTKNFTCSKGVNIMSSINGCVTEVSILSCLVSMQKVTITKISCRKETNYWYWHSQVLFVPLAVEDFWKHA